MAHGSRKKNQIAMKHVRAQNSQIRVRISFCHLLKFNISSLWTNRSVGTEKWLPNESSGLCVRMLFACWFIHFVQAILCKKSTTKKSAMRQDWMEQYKIKIKPIILSLKTVIVKLVACSTHALFFGLFVWSFGVEKFNEMYMSLTVCVCLCVSVSFAVKRFVPLWAKARSMNVTQWRLFD